MISLVSVLSCTSTPLPSPWIERLQRLPIKTVEVDDYEIAYLEAGQGAPVILIHGFGGSMWQWEYQYPILSSHYRVITLDLLGSGLSDKPDISYSPERMLQFFTGFLKAVDIKKTTLIGNSMGAGLAIAMALSYPHQVECLILIDALPSDPVSKIESPRYKQFLERRPPLWLAKLGNWMGGRWATESILREIVHDQTLITPLVIERSFQNRRVPGFLPPLYSLLENMSNWNKEFAHRMSEIHHPTLIIWGEHDRVFPLPVGLEIHKLISNSTFHPIPDAGHIPQWEQPAHVNATILEFLEKQVS